LRPSFAQRIAGNVTSAHTKRAVSLADRADQKLGRVSHAKQLEQRLRAVRLCPDEWITALGSGLWESDLRRRIEELQWKLAQDLLALGHTIVIEWGTWARSERDTLRKGARALGAAVELHFLDVPLTVLLDRIRLRNREHPPVTLDDLMKWDGQFQRPCAEEMSLFDSDFKCVE
jgi:predicted kinase